MELYERVLEAGINIVTTADWVTGDHRDTNHRRGAADSEVLQAACVRGNSTFYGTGMPALNSIRAVVDAPPDIVTSADLPLHAFAGRFAR